MIVYINSIGCMRTQADMQQEWISKINYAFLSLRFCPPTTPAQNKSFLPPPMLTLKETLYELGFYTVSIELHYLIDCY